MPSRQLRIQFIKLAAIGFRSNIRLNESDAERDEERVRADHHHHQVEYVLCRVHNIFVKSRLSLSPSSISITSP